MYFVDKLAATSRAGLGLREREIFDDRFAESDEGFDGEGQALSLPQKETPPAFKFAFAQGQGAERTLGQFLAGDPASEDADAQAEFDQFFDRLHIAQLYGGWQKHVFLVKIVIDQAVVVTAAGVKDEPLPGDLVAGDFSGARPGMGGAEQEEQFILEQGAEFENGFFARFERESEIDAMLP